jgi:hypothetical protein
VRGNFRQSKSYTRRWARLAAMSGAGSAINAPIVSDNTETTQIALS